MDANMVPFLFSAKFLLVRILIQNGDVSLWKDVQKQLYFWKRLNATTVVTVPPTTPAIAQKVNNVILDGIKNVSVSLKKK